VPDLVTGAEDAFIDGVDSALVELLRIGNIGYVDRQVSRAEVLAASYRFRWTPTCVADRFVELGFSVPSRDDLVNLGRNTTTPTVHV
jgi:hypothetical protein